MKRILRFKDGVIYGTIKDEVVKILPQLESSFVQRKNFYEYYFNDTEIEISLEQLDKLSDEYRISIDFDSITILE
jgi:hypothetical protein